MLSVHLSHTVYLSVCHVCQHLRATDLTQSLLHRVEKSLSKHR